MSLVDVVFTHRPSPQVILEGNITLEDRDTGIKLEAKAGDVINSESCRCKTSNTRSALRKALYPSREPYINACVVFEQLLLAPQLPSPRQTLVAHSTSDNASSATSNRF